MKNMLMVLVLGFSGSVYANSYIVCGSGDFEWDGMEFEKLELTLSSENDDYNGPVGKRWNMRIGEGDWIESGKVSAKSTKKDGITTVEIKIVQAKSASGPVGIRYVLSDLYAEEPSLKKFNFGGFTGTLEVGAYACAASFD